MNLYSAKVTIFYIFRWKDSVYQMICVINVKTCVQLNTYINHWVDVYTCAFECLNLSKRKSCEMNNNSFPAPTILPVMILLYSMTPQEYCILSEYNAYYGDAIENHGWFLHLAHCLQLICMVDKTFALLLTHPSSTAIHAHYAPEIGPIWFMISSFVRNI